MSATNGGTAVNIGKSNVATTVETKIKSVSLKDP